MDQRSTSRTAEMSDVQAGLGISPDIDARTGQSTEFNVDRPVEDRTALRGKVTPVPHNLEKYYFQRYRLFHHFEDGIQLDEESWYSVTPEKIAAHHAQRFAALRSETENDPVVVVDAFCGAGGNSIQLARYAHVIAIDKSPERINLARHNARVYGVDAYIDFILGDVKDVLPALTGLSAENPSNFHPIPDGVIMSPPWGGPSYGDIPEYNVEQFVPIVKCGMQLSENVAILMPRTVSERAVQKHFGPCEFERNFLGGNLKTVTLYFGKLMFNNRRLKT